MATSYSASVISPQDSQLLWVLPSEGDEFRCELRFLGRLGWEVRTHSSDRLLHTLRSPRKRAALRWALGSRARLSDRS